MQLERDHKEDLYLYYTYQKLEYLSYYCYALMNYCENTKGVNAHKDKPAETSWSGKGWCWNALDEKSL